MIYAIACVDKNWGIGKDGDMLFHIKEDLQFFKEKTIGKTVMMGRKTLESLPNGKPLKDRGNIIITRQEECSSDGLFKVNMAFAEALLWFADFRNEDVFIIGGGTIYEQLLSKCKVAYITKVDEEKDADTFFPNLDKMDNWFIVNDEKLPSGDGWKVVKYKKYEL